MTIDWIEVRCPCCRSLLLVALPALKGPAAPRCEECDAALDAAAVLGTSGAAASAPATAAARREAVPLAPT